MATKPLPYGGVHHYVNGKFVWGPAPTHGLTDTHLTTTAKGTAIQSNPNAGNPSDGRTVAGPQSSTVSTQTDPTQTSAYAQLEDVLQQAGLTSLNGTLKNLIQGGQTDSSVLNLALQDTSEWKQRFAGNEQLKAKGLDVLSVSEYLAQEKAYAQVLSTAGLPAGFYDSRQDFANFIGNNVSASELQSRVKDYTDLAQREDKGTLDQLAAMGMSHGDLAAFMMDPTKAAPLIQQKYNQVLIGAAANNAGVSASQADIATLAAQGVSEQQAVQGFGQIGQTLPTAQRLGDIYGTSYGFGDAEAEVFNNNAQATAKRTLLASQERAAFGGSGGVTSGSIRRDDTGQY